MTVTLFLAINAMFNWPVISLPVVVSKFATRRGHGSRVTTGCASPRKRAGVDGGTIQIQNSVCGLLGMLCHSTCRVPSGKRTNVTNWKD